MLTFVAHHAVAVGRHHVLNSSPSKSLIPLLPVTFRQSGGVLSFSTRSKRRLTRRIQIRILSGMTMLIAIFRGLRESLERQQQQRRKRGTKGRSNYDLSERTIDHGDSFGGGDEGS